MTAKHKMIPSKKGLNPELAAKALLDIQEKYGCLKHEYVIKEARNPRHILHNYFEWNQKKAAEKYLIEQSRQLIRSLLVLNESEGKMFYTRAFMNIVKDDEQELTTNLFNVKESLYLSTDVVMASEDLKLYSLKRALLEMKAFRRKYGLIKELSKVITAIDDFLDENK